MEPLSETRLRDSFSNCSKGEAARIVLPDLATLPWADLDFLGWRNQRTPQRAHLVTLVDAEPMGLLLRAAENRGTSGAMRSSMCEFCQTVHSGGGVTLFTAKKVGGSGRRGDSVGTYICSNLECSAYIRGRKRPARVQPESTLTEAERIERLTTKLDGFMRRVLDPTG